MNERERYFRQLRRLRRSARRWSVLAGTLAGTTAVLVPYHGLGWPDAIWAALTGGTAALTWWRWSDLRELAAQPPPESVEPVRYPVLGSPRMHALLSRFPAGRNALAELGRMQSRARVRGSSVLPAWNRLDRAAQTFVPLAGRLDGPARPIAQEAAAAERYLRELGERTAAVERALRLGPGDARLAASHQELLRHFTQGVDAYEKLVAAAAGYVAENGRTVVLDGGSYSRLTEATDLLAGIAAALSELRTATRPA
ncbi:MAG TPA: hypothetical protein VJT31_39095 [Rugosimonospora sp.]|nr:hypothetical protein [Rugosimonospora sp.]